MTQNIGQYIHNTNNTNNDSPNIFIQVLSLLFRICPITIKYYNN